MEISISPITAEDRVALIDVFNYYVVHSFAAFPEAPLPYEAFDMLMKMAEGYPTAAVKDNGLLVGFGLLRPHHPMPAFARTAEITYFIMPEFTGKGIGKRLLDHLEAEGKKRGISCLLACISSLNPGSINFHLKNGFVECGRFRNVGRKKGQDFDTVWMQKMI